MCSETYFEQIDKNLSLKFEIKFEHAQAIMRTIHDCLSS